MKLNRTYSIVLVTAIFHLLGDVAFAGGAVLCVGPNNHTEIEAGNVARECGLFRAADVQSVDDPHFAVGATSDCTDIPVHCDPEMASKDSFWDPASPAILTLTSGSCSRLLRGIDLRIGLGDDLTPTMRAHRSIVLII